MEKDGEISFKAISKGLGFHPFSDGLPYAPASNTNPEKSSSRGMGATAAGRPTFAKSIPLVSDRPKNPAPKPYIAPSPLTKTVPPAPSVEQTRSLLMSQVPTEAYGFTYLLKRSCAYAVDTIIHCVLGGGALIAIADYQRLNLNLLFSPGVILVFVAFLAVLNWALITAQEIVFGATIGKKTFGLYLEGSTGTILLRSVGFIFSVAFSGVGIVWALFDSKRRCWHDVVSGVQPQELAKI
jgi:hypothetical protein